MNDSRHLQHCWTVVWNVPMNFVGWPQHAALCSKICAKAAEQWPKGIPHCCLQWAQGTGQKWPQLHLQYYYCWWIWVFRYEPKTKQQSSQWKTPTSPRQKKAQLFRAMANQCWFVFSTMKALCIRRKHPDSGVTTPAPCIMTMFRFMRHSCCSFWFLWTWQSFPTLPTHPSSPPVIFSYTRRWNWSSRGDVLKALKRFRPNHETLWRRWHKFTSNSASDHGNPAGTTVSM